MGTPSSHWATYQGHNADMEERSSFLFPSLHSITWSGWWAEKDAGTTQLYCLPFGETVKKLWHCFATRNMWDATVRVWLLTPLPGKVRSAATESFLTFLSTTQREVMVTHIDSSEIQWIQLWGSVIQRDAAGKQRLKLGSGFLQFLLVWVSSYILVMWIEDCTSHGSPRCGMGDVWDKTLILKIKF